MDRFFLFFCYFMVLSFYYMFLFQNSFVVITPEDTMLLVTSGANEKTEWVHAFQNAIKWHLDKSTAPPARNAVHVFTKPPYKDAKYSGECYLTSNKGVSIKGP